MKKKQLIGILGLLSVAGIGLTVGQKAVYAKDTPSYVSGDTCTLAVVIDGQKYPNIYTEQKLSSCLKSAATWFPTWHQNKDVIVVVNHKDLDKEIRMQQ